MIINNVRIFLNEQKDSGMKAVVTMLLNNQILLQGIRIFESEDKEPRLRVSYPVQWMGNGNLRHCLYPSNEKSRAKFDSAILEAYQKVLSGEAPDNTVVFNDEDACPGYEITRAGVFPISSTGSHRAKVSIEMDGELWMRGMLMTVRRNGALFLNMPSRQMGKEDKYMAYFHPVDQEARSALMQAVMPYYEESIHSA